MCLCYDNQLQRNEAKKKNALSKCSRIIIRPGRVHWSEGTLICLSFDEWPSWAGTHRSNRTVSALRFLLVTLHWTPTELPNWLRISSRILSQMAGDFHLPTIPSLRSLTLFSFSLIFVSFDSLELFYLVYLHSVFGAYYRDRWIHYAIWRLSNVVLLTFWLFS